MYKHGLFFPERFFRKLRHTRTFENDKLRFMDIIQSFRAKIDYKKKRFLSKVTVN